VTGRPAEGDARPTGLPTGLTNLTLETLGPDDAGLCADGSCALPSS
jgi:hypothetical protein